MKQDISLWPQQLVDNETIVTLWQGGELAKYRIVTWDGFLLWASRLSDPDKPLPPPEILLHPCREGD